MVYSLGFGTFSPLYPSTSDGIDPRFRSLAFYRREAAKYDAVLDIKQGTPVAEVVERYMKLRGLGTGDARELEAKFQSLSRSIGAETLERARNRYERSEEALENAIHGISRQSMGRGRAYF